MPSNVFDTLQAKSLGALPVVRVDACRPDDAEIRFDDGHWRLHPVKVEIGWSRSGPVVKRPGTCESCGQSFACELSIAGCWCSKVDLTDAARARIRADYSGCLCPACLRQYETP